MFSVVGAILAIGLLIIVHEAGHYFVARWCKMRVDRFSIGFGPPLLSWRRGETDFTLGPIFFGGFVQINGMTMVDEIDPNDERQYPNRPVWQRFATIFAGPACNYLAAIVIAFVLFGLTGIRTGTTWYSVGSIAENMKTANGLEVGDKITRVGDTPIYFTLEGQKEAPKTLQEYVQDSKGGEMKIGVLRDGKELELLVTPRLKNLGCNWLWWESKCPIEASYMLGIRLLITEERVDVGIVSAVGHAFAYPVRQTRVIGQGLYDIVTGKEKGEVSSVVGIAAVAKKQFDKGWADVLKFLMLLNVYLGLFNLLPLPALDGGRLVFLVYEMTTRRRANPKIEATVHMVGIMALLLVMVLVTYNDIVKLF